VIFTGYRLAGSLLLLPMGLPTDGRVEPLATLYEFLLCIGFVVGGRYLSA
jgi:hypothetical protein